MKTPTRKQPGQARADVEAALNQALRIIPHLRTRKPETPKKRWGLIEGSSDPGDRSASYIRGSRRAREKAGGNRLGAVFADEFDALRTLQDLVAFLEQQCYDAELHPHLEASKSERINGVERTVKEIERTVQQVVRLVKRSGAGGPSRAA